jgi:predicted O-linked N-acetylglucosamine transferase (SPINDLY family)
MTELEDAELKTIEEGVSTIYKNPIWSNYYKVGMAYRKLNRHSDAIHYFKMAYERAGSKEQLTSIANVVATSYKDSGDIDAAIEWYFKIKHPINMRNGLMCMGYSDKYDLHAYAAKVKEYESLFPIVPFEPIQYSHARPRLGVCSPDLRAHSLASILPGMIHGLKELGFDTFGYMTKPDDFDINNRSCRLWRSCFNSFRLIKNKTDIQVAGLIRADEIDILIDITGYTDSTCIDVFRYKPGSIQGGYCSGMMTPSGLSTMDFFLSSKTMTPKDISMFDTKIIDMNNIIFYDLSDIPEVDTTRSVVFMVFNNPCKYNNTSIEVWSKILHLVPSSKLAIKIMDLAHGTKLIAQFSGLGIDQSRIILVPQLPSKSDVKNIYTNLGMIQLDTFPCGGCLTTAESLGYGVPVVTIKGSTFLARQSYAVLDHAGVPELACDSIEAYIDLAVQLGRSPDRIKGINNKIRKTSRMVPSSDEFAKVLRDLLDARN